MTDSDPSLRAAPNLLLGQPAPTAPNQVWVGDSPQGLRIKIGRMPLQPLVPFYNQL